MPVCVVHLCLKVLDVQSLCRLKTDIGTAIASSAASAVFRWSDKAFCWRTMPSCVLAVVKHSPALAYHLIVVSDVYGTVVCSAVGMYTL